MRFSPQFLDELKARLPVSEVVGKRVKLTRAGREFKGLSPFNKEKTPSFFVNDQKQAWFDFSSQKNGSVFDFVMETEGVTFPEAVERLAGMAGMPLPKASPEEDARQERRRTLHEVAELAAQFFEQTLAARAGAKARGYLADRGIAPATQLQFRLGYAPPERFALKEFLGGKGVPAADMVEAGLLVAGDDVPVPFDRFRDRVMFPIADARSRVIAFGGRALEKDAPAKYLNSPETPLFHKGGTLYNLAAARSAAHTNAALIVVEGYVDVIALVAAGFQGAVAPLGTALTEDQLALIWRMADEPVLCFDGDGAGRRAAFRAVDLALPALKPGKSLKFATLPQGQDPDDLIRAAGPAAMQEVLAGARPLADMLWLRETDLGGFDTPERRAALEARLEIVLRAIGDESVRRYYRQDFQARLRQFFAPPPNAATAYRRDRDSRFAKRFPAARSSPGRRPMPEPPLIASPQLAASPVLRGHLAAVPRREALIVLTILNHPWLLHDHLEDFSHLEFRHRDTGKLKDALIDICSHDATIEPEQLRAYVMAQGAGDLLSRVEQAITTVSVWGARPDAAPEDVRMTWHQLLALHRQWHSLLKELKDAERALGQQGTEANYSWLCDVKARLSGIDGTEALIEGFGVSSGRAMGNV